MENLYKEVPNTINKEQIKIKGSFSGKDYSTFFDPQEYKELRDMVDYKVGNSFLSTDFIYEDVSSDYRFIKTGNLYNHRMLVDYTSTEYCKPVGTSILEDEDILIAKDGNGVGLGEVSIYFKDDRFRQDYISGEVLRIRARDDYDKWFILGILKSLYFKEFLDSVTPGGSTLRHSKLLALDFKVPYYTDKEQKRKYISLLVQNLVDKEKQLKIKREKIDNIIKTELPVNSTPDFRFSYPSISKIKDEERIDTGIYSEEYTRLVNSIKNYSNGFFYMNESDVSPGRTPKDYKYTIEKRNNAYLWITPKNINSLELSYYTYIHTLDSPRTKDYSIILSSIRYMGYGFLVDGEENVYCNQNTLIINHSDDKNEQIFLLAFFTSSIGKKLQYARRADGLVPIIYKNQLMKIPIPKFNDEVKNEIVSLYYNNFDLDNQNFTQDNYLLNVKDRNKNIGIYQLNLEILSLIDEIKSVVHSYILEEEFEPVWFK